jgi:MFS family permease
MCGFGFAAASDCGGPGQMTQAQAQEGVTGRSAGSLRNYWLLFSAFFVSTAGDWLYKLALPLLVLRMTGSPLQTAVVYSLQYWPYLIFALAGGVIADRANRRILLIRADAAAAVVVGLLALAVWRGDVHLWMVYLGAFALSGISPLYQASFQALMPRTVEPERLGWANSRMQASQGALDIAGPLLGAGAVAVLGTTGALSLDSASYALSALAAALIARAVADRPAAAHGTVLADLRAAVSFLRATPAISCGALLAAGNAFGLFMVESNMITYLVRFRHQSVGSVGVVFAALGVGSLVSALLAPRILRAVKPGLLIIVCTLGGGLATATLLVLRNLLAIAAAWVFVGAFTMIFIVTFYTLRQQLVPEDMLGRVVVLTRLVAFGPLPIAPLIGGALLGATGHFWPVLVISVVVQVAASIFAWFTPLRTATGVPAPSGAGT